MWNSSVFFLVYVRKQEWISVRWSCNLSDPYFVHWLWWRVPPPWMKIIWSNHVNFCSCFLNSLLITECDIKFICEIHLATIRWFQQVGSWAWKHWNQDRWWGQGYEYDALKAKETENSLVRETSSNDDSLSARGRQRTNRNLINPKVDRSQTRRESTFTATTQN